MWEAVKKEARKRKADALIYTSWSTGTRKNPLSPGDKILYIKKMLPTGIKISEDQTLKNTQQIAKDLIAKGYTKLVLVVGADRLSDFDAMKKQVKEYSSGGTVLEVISFSGKTRTGNYSGTRMRQLAKDNNFKDFYDDLPDKISKRDAEEMFKKVQVGLGVE
jgi:hypothetical protein